MKRLLYVFIVVALCLSDQAGAQPLPAHAWQGRKVGYIGDSITDPNCIPGVKLYWEFLADWLQITPFVAAVSGGEWKDVPHQGEQLLTAHPGDVDAILVFLGTNDFNAGVPLGEWFTETKEEVMAATGEPQRLYLRNKRTPVMSDSTFRGRINIGLNYLKSHFPEKQIVLLTPIHRAYAKFSDDNVQPDERYQNKCGAYIDDYVQAVKEAANVWSVPVIDLNAVSGLNPMIEEHLPLFRDPSFDRLHPNSKGHERIARTLYYQLMALPCLF